MLYESDRYEELIKDYLPLVNSVVNKIDNKNTNFDRDDLVSIGVIGLMDALEKFDGSKNVPFEAYARIRIRGTIIDELRKAGPVSRSRMEKLNAYYQKKSNLEHTLMRTPTEKEICSELDIDKEDLSSIHETVQHLSGVSLESLIYSDEGENVELLDMIEDEDALLPEKYFSDLELKDILTSSIDKLEEREKILLDLYYVQELTMKEIAYVLDISIPRVSQIHGKVLEKLKYYMEPYVEG